MHSFVSRTSDAGLTVGHEEFGDEVYVPVPSSAHGLGRALWKTEALVQLWRIDSKEKHEQHPVKLHNVKASQED